MMCKIEHGPQLFNIYDSLVNFFKVVVESLSLGVVEHPQPYEFLCYNKKIRVMKQAKVTFSTGTKYHDNILFDVADIDQFYVCLGKPWKSYCDVWYESKSYYDMCYKPSNKGYNFVKGEQIV